jgi:predicted ATPase
MKLLSLRSIQPLNLLSFGPETEPIEIRPLNILIGANGSGKSNFIEVVRLLHFLPDKEPWGVVKGTGGVGEWAWKGRKLSGLPCALRARFSFEKADARLLGWYPKELDFQVTLEISGPTFRIASEALQYLLDGRPNELLSNSFVRNGSSGRMQDRLATEVSDQFELNAERSVLSQLASGSLQHLGSQMPEVYDLAEYLESFDFHQDWEFGVDCAPREPQPVGQPVDRLEEDASNLAQMLAHFRDNHKDTFYRLTDYVSRFYDSAKSVEIPILSTHLQIAIGERNGHTTPAARLSDGMLRWLAILAILLNPNPAPVTCIDEPELGLHPDIMPMLADLLREASSRTQLIVTTHSPTLVDAFSEPEDAESICVTEKIEGSTVIRRLKADDLSVWLKDYSLGSLWTSGQVGGGRW